MNDASRAGEAPGDLLRREGPGRMPRRQRSRGHRRRPWRQLLSFLRRGRTLPLRRYPEGCLGLPLQYAVLDVETTGLDPVRDRVVEVAVVLLDSHGHALHEWSTLVNPGIGTSGPRHIHGIASEWLADAPPFSAVVGDIGARPTRPAGTRSRLRCPQW